MANLMRQLQAIAMTAGSEKRQQDSRYNFNLRAGRSKIVPFYFCKRNSDGSIDNNEYFNLTANYPNQEINWKAKCSGGYYSLTAFNREAVGQKLGLTLFSLNKANVDLMLSGKMQNKSGTLNEILQDTLKDDVDARRFVPHMKEVVIQPRMVHHEEGNMPTGKGTNPVTTQGMKGMIISNITPITAASNGGIEIQIRQDFYQYEPGIGIPSRATFDSEE